MVVVKTWYTYVNISFKSQLLRWKIGALENVKNFLVKLLSTPQTNSFPLPKICCFSTQYPLYLKTVPFLYYYYGGYTFGRNIVAFHHKHGAGWLCHPHNCFHDWRHSGMGCGWSLHQQLHQGIFKLIYLL